MAGGARKLAAAFVRPMLIAALAGVFMAYAGAFGTGAAPLPLRLGFWVVTMAVASLLGTAMVLPPYLRGWFEGRWPLMVIGLALALSLPLTLLVWLMTNLFFAGHMKAAPPTLASYYLPVLAVSVVMTGVNVLAAERRRGRVLAPVPPPLAAVGPPRFLERIPARLRGGELYAVQAEDHYLRLHTSRGSDLILMRLADALAELEGIEGARTHRSWWVARAAVAEGRRGDGRAVLTLKDGTQAPVSRRYAGALREAGWFK